MPECDAEFDAMEAAYSVSLTTQAAENAALTAYVNAEIANEAAMVSLMNAAEDYDMCMQGGGEELQSSSQLSPVSNLKHERARLIRARIDEYLRGRA